MSRFEHPSPALSTTSNFSDFTDEELDKYFASYVPLSNLPTPPPAKENRVRRWDQHDGQAPELESKSNGCFMVTSRVSIFSCPPVDGDGGMEGFGPVDHIVAQHNHQHHLHTNRTDVTRFSTSPFFCTFLFSCHYWNFYCWNCRIHMDIGSTINHAYSMNFTCDNNNNITYTILTTSPFT